MARALRVLTGAVMLIVLLGLPVAPVWCELACAQGHDQAAAAPVPSPAAPSCHETANAPAAVPVASAATIATTAAPECTHPVVVAPARTPDVSRTSVPVPTMVAEIGPFARVAPATVTRVGHPEVRGPAPPRGPAFSPVLRI